MTDLRVLTDAFTELERRADAATAATADDVAVTTAAPFPVPARDRSRHTQRRGARLVPVAAAVAVVAGVSTAVVVFASGSDSGVQTAAPPESGTVSTTLPAPRQPPGPHTPEDLIAGLRAALGDTATFTVTHTGPGAAVMTLPSAPVAASGLPIPGAVVGTGPPASVRVSAVPPGPTSATGNPAPSKTIGAAIGGILTASGVTGGFDLISYPTDPKEYVWCQGCTPTRLPDGSQLASGQVELEGGPNGRTFDVTLLRLDGVVFEMHVSNQRSPKGASETLGAHPPLTIDQMIAILTSDRLSGI